MQADARLCALANRVGAFHITDRAMARAQEHIRAAIDAGEVGESARREYVEALRRYFTGFAREARMHLRDVDRRLAELNQVQFNLTAERGVAVKRIEATEGVLRELDGVEGVPAP